jgi:hypothetical protein
MQFSKLHTTVLIYTLNFRLPLAEEDRTVNETEVSSLTTAIGISYQILTTLVDGKFTLNHVDRYFF